MTFEEPMFMRHPEWLDTPPADGEGVAFFDDGRGYHLKDGAPEDVRASYEEFYAAMEAPGDMLVKLVGL